MSWAAAELGLNSSGERLGIRAAGRALVGKPTCRAPD